MIPVIIFGYSRKSELLNVLNLSLLNKSPQIYINLDFPVTNEIQIAQMEILEEIRIVMSKNPDVQIKIRRSKSNLGAAHSIISGIDWFFSEQISGLILEDDLDFSIDFFRFANKALKILDEVPDVWIVSGSNFFPSPDVKQASLVNYPVTWGWATTKSKWIQMRQGILTTPKLKSIRLFSKRNYWWLGSKRSHKGFVDAWDIPLAWAMKISNKYSIIPPVNLVSNIGYSNSASNTVGLTFPLNFPIGKLSQTFEINADLHRDRRNEILLEKMVYKINYLRRFGFIFSFFDSIRFRKKRNTTLNSRISTSSGEIFEYLDFSNHL